MDYVENILDAWDKASDAQRTAGRAWYTEAHKVALQVGNGDARMGAGVIAALSPQKQWHVNVMLAHRISSGDFSGHTTDSLDKARAIMQGCDPGDVLPEGKKTWNFFYNIWLPIAEQWVTVDRHAYRVATCEWDNGNPRITVVMYREIAAAYIQAGQVLCEIPADVQAGTWVWATQG